MSTLTKVLNAQQEETMVRSIDELLAMLEAEEQHSDGLCPNRLVCFETRLGVRQSAIEDGWRCGFEATHCLWQCHLSGKASEGTE